MTNPVPPSSGAPSTVPRWASIAAGFAGAIVAGGLLGVLVTGAANLVGRNDPTAQPTPSATVRAAVDPTPAPSATATPPATASPILAPSPSPTAEPSGEPRASPSATPIGILPEGCFSEGFLVPSAEEELEPVVVPNLRDRLPLPHPWLSTPYAWVGSSLTDGFGEIFVNAFAACTGVDPSAIRYGAVSGGLTSGVLPQAIQVDGFTGPELADTLVEGYLWPQQIAELRTGTHDGWSYRYVDWFIAVTASADTVYWFWVFPCCYGNEGEDRPDFRDVVHEYLERVDDEPAPSS
jgi:hypothetical protein